MGVTSLLVLSIASVLLVASYGLLETEALLKFKKSLKIGENNALASWNGKEPPCKWAGILCNGDTIWGLQLENMELSGTIDVDALKGLPHLRTLSFMNNKFGGSMPEFKKISALKSLYLSKNQFEGEIPGDAFEGMQWLKKVHLAQNKFTGEIPMSLTHLPKLLVLRLDGNQFSGKIPAFKQKLRKLNLSDNALTGPIPDSLSLMDPKVFAGNKDLCGKPLNRECDPVPLGTGSFQSPNVETGTNRSTSNAPIIIAAVVAGVAVLIIVLGVVLLSRRKRQPPLPVETGPSNLQKKSGIQDPSVQSSQCRSRCSPDHHFGGSTTRKRAAATSTAEAMKLLFLRDDREEFDLQELLKASAEILGSGCFGASYKAVLLTGPVMVVKRFKQMNNVGREDFQEHMRRLGRLSHKNLLPLVAYYYRKEEKLLVGDFVERGSLAVHLHGHQSLGQRSLDWPTRLKIVKGVAKGLQYLYKELPSLITPHGHLKSSNVLLNENLEPLLTDYGLVPVINQENAHELMVAYKSPEYLQHGRITKKTDLWGLGILILEILTGKFPAVFLPKGKGTDEDLASWVNSVFQGEWTSEVFDKEMVKTGGFEGEILKLLNIGLNCCETDVEKRLDINEAVERIEELGEKEGGEEFSSTYASEADGEPPKGMSSEFINLP